MGEVQLGACQAKGKSWVPVHEWCRVYACVSGLLGVSVGDTRVRGGGNRKHEVEGVVGQVGKRDFWVSWQKSRMVTMKSLILSRVTSKHLFYDKERVVFATLFERSVG